MQRLFFILLLGEMLSSGIGRSAEMRGCHQTCADLLNHDARCENLCAEKDLHPDTMGFCPEHQPCMKACDLKFPDHQSAGWGDCRDVCTAVYIRVECAYDTPRAAKGGEAPVTQGSVVQGSGGLTGAVRAMQQGTEIAPASAQGSDRAHARLEKSLLKPFDGKGQMENVKVKDPLQPSNSLEGIVQEAIAGSASGMTGDGTELTLFARVHRKYQERLATFLPR